MKEDIYTISRTNLSYNGGAYRNSMDIIQRIKKSVEDNPEILGKMECLVEAVQKANHIIYDPLIDIEKISLVKFSLNDYHTDLKGLEDLKNIFKIK
jgi:hypothetical protein